jgi:hypothetical protein
MARRQHIDDSVPPAPHLDQLPLDRLVVGNFEEGDELVGICVSDLVCGHPSHSRWFCGCFSSCLEAAGRSSEVRPCGASPVAWFVKLPHARQPLAQPSGHSSHVRPASSASSSSGASGTSPWRRRLPRGLLLTTAARTPSTGGSISQRCGAHPCSTIGAPGGGQHRGHIRVRHHVAPVVVAARRGSVMDEASAMC